MERTGISLLLRSEAKINKKKYNPAFQGQKPKTKVQKEDIVTT
jgi:hypothetical protein